jgi:uncharacterized membrane protein YgaE (UPF0421/DUF939 family)
MRIPDNPMQSGKVKSSDRLDTRQLIAHGIGRLRAGFGPVVLAALAAALAWLLAHNVLGHPQAFFAPIAATISLSISRIQRSRRIVQMVGGVLLGIGIGELLVAILGTTTVALGLIVLLTLSAALLSGEGIFGEGMMFANQAAASAILVVTLHRAGTGSERVVDALVGGGVALVLGVGLFPAHPLRLLEDAERALLRALAAPLQEAARLIGTAQAPPPDWALRSGQHVHQLLGGLARTRATAHANVRVAPRRWRLRAIVDAEIERTEPLDLLANAVLSLVRATASRDIPMPTPLERDITALGESIAVLAEAPRPWAGGTLEGVRRQARRARDAAGRVLAETPVVAAIVRAIATDLEAVARVPEGVTSPATVPPAPRPNVR